MKGTVSDAGCAGGREKRSSVRVCVDTERKGATHLFGGDRSLTCLSKFLDHSRIASEILLTPNKDDRQPSAEMHHFGDPLHTVRPFVSGAPTK